MNAWLAYALGVATPLAISGAGLALFFLADLHYHAQTQHEHITPRGAHWHAFRGSMPGFWRRRVALPRSIAACERGTPVLMNRDLVGGSVNPRRRNRYTNTEEDPLWQT